MEKQTTTLTLALQKPWFDLIKAGIKLEEYRRFGCIPYGTHLTPKERRSIFYWNNRLIKHFYPKLDPTDKLKFIPKHFDTLVFTLGYPSKTDTSRRLVFKNPKIDIREGKPEWGAEPGIKYFVITWET